MKRGAIRSWLETLKMIAQISGLSLEQIADVFDANQALLAQPKDAADDDPKPLASGPKGVQ
jgi:hypothetical protein